MSNVPQQQAQLPIPGLENPYRQAQEAAPQQQEQEEKPATLADLVEEIIDMAGLTPEDADQLPYIPYFNAKGADGKIIKWTAREAVPGRANLMIMGLFRNEEEIYAYCYPKGDAEPKEGEALGFTRYAISRYHASAPVPEIMGVDVFKAEFAAELESINTNSAYNAPRVDCAVETCSTSNEGDAIFCKECGAKIPEADEAES